MFAWLCEKTPTSWKMYFGRDLLLVPLILEMAAGLVIGVVFSFQLGLGWERVASWPLGSFKIVVACLFYWPFQFYALLFLPRDGFVMLAIFGWTILVALVTLGWFREHRWARIVAHLLSFAFLVVAFCRLGIDV